MQNEIKMQIEIQIEMQIINPPSSPPPNPKTLQGKRKAKKIRNLAFCCWDEIKGPCPSLHPSNKGGKDGPGGGGGKSR